MLIAFPPCRDPFWLHMMVPLRTPANGCFRPSCGRSAFGSGLSPFAKIGRWRPTKKKVTAFISCRHQHRSRVSSQTAQVGKSASPPFQIGENGKTSTTSADACYHSIRLRPHRNQLPLTDLGMTKNAQNQAGLLEGFYPVFFMFGSR